MSVTAHRTGVDAQVPAPRTEPRAPARVLRRVPAHRPPTRRRVVRVGASRVVASCAPRRPRLSVAGVLAVASVACAAVVGLGALSGSVEPMVPSETTVVRVQPGESLWELAGRVAPGSDASAVVERIRELNGVDGAVQPGQPLTVPFEG
ncbi:MAG: LysM peptidoglycan-binding domain-containing protein [Actinophytocola sp.]|uniref:LysM peptidoglycan-binding domain-containing protein n=1 Tax=Actinophytocola sp. TaxID=1872138 RepID=UPI003C7885D1